MTFAQRVSNFVQDLSDLVVPRPHDGEVCISAFDLEKFKARENLAVRISYFNPTGSIYCSSGGALAPEACVIAPPQLPGQRLSYLVETKIDGVKGRAIINDAELTALTENLRAQVAEHGKVKDFSLSKVTSENT